MKNSRMSLDAFKANAELANEMIALDAIQGGALDDCHGFIGQSVKSVKNLVVNVHLEDWKLAITITTNP